MIKTSESNLAKSPTTQSDRSNMFHHCFVPAYSGEGGKKKSAEMVARLRVPLCALPNRSTRSAFWRRGSTRCIELGQLDVDPLQRAVGWAKARSAVPTKPFREALMSRYRRLKIEGGLFFYRLALANWSFCSFHRYVAQGILPGDWAGDAADYLDASVNEGVGAALRAFAHPCHSEIEYRRHVPKGMLCRGQPSAAERLAIGSSPP